MPNLFDIPFVKLDTIIKGEPIKSVRDKLNAPILAVNQLLGGVKPPQQKKPDAANNPNPLQVKAFQIKSVESDWLVAEDGTRIAKPDTLLTSLWNGLEDEFGIFYEYKTPQVRTAFSTIVDPTTLEETEKEEDQIITPTYSVGQWIYAVKGIGGGGTGVIDNNDEKVEWLDLNADARAWAATGGTIMIEGGVVILDNKVIAIEY